MSLALLVGPANAGKVANLLDRYVASLEHEPVLVVPNRNEVERIERDLLTRTDCLLGGWIGTFDDLFRRLAVREGTKRVLLGSVARSLLLTRLARNGELRELAPSARFPGFVEALGDALAELAGAGVHPDEVPGDLGLLYRAYAGELERLGVEDVHTRAARAAARVAEDLDAWNGSPVFVYGFEDLTGAQWSLLEALAGRTDVCVSLPYEPGRPAFAALERTAAGLAELAGDGIEELPAQAWYEAESLRHLERTLFEDAGGEQRPLDGGVRFLEAAGTRAALELVGDEILQLLRDGARAEQIAVVVPSVERVRAPLETAFASLGVPYAVEGPVRLGRTPLGRALLGLVRFAWLGGVRRDLFAFLRSPYSGLPRSKVDFVEGRLRGRGVSDAARTEAETLRHLGQPLHALDELRAAPTPVAGIRALARRMLQAAWGLERPPEDEAAALDLRAAEAVDETLLELDAWAELAGGLEPADVAAALERAAIYPRTGSDGRVAVLDLLRARTRRFDVVFVLGLEEGVLPRRGAGAPFLDDELRSSLEAAAGRRRRLARGDDVARDRYLFYTACTRPWRRLYLVREAASDDGRPIEPSPFYEEVRSRFRPEDVERWTRRRPLSALAWELHEAPTQRERLRAVAALAAREPGVARAVAAAAGWQRQLERALEAFSRPTRLRNPHVIRRLRELDRFSVTELELYGDCSSLWLVDRVVEPKAIDAEIDPRLRGQVAHQTLFRFYAGLPKRFGSDVVDLGRLDEAVEFLYECLDEAIAGHVRLDVPELDLLELRSSLGRDLEHFVRQDAELGLQLVPRRFEVSFGSDRAAPELQRGLELGGFTVSGKIDRVDVDPFSARGIVQDYKSGEAIAARRIESEKRLQIPLYVLALRDLVGVEPLGGLYRSLSGEREARGMVRAGARADVPGLPAADYLDEERFWGLVEGAATLARQAVAGIRDGRVEHDPRWPDGCPSWCDRWPMCRVSRA